MPEVYANDLTEVLDVLATNDEVRQKMIQLIRTAPVAGKVTEGGDRLKKFRVILEDVANGTLNFNQAIRRIEAELPRATSVHSGSNRVFPAHWAERHMLTQFSRFYNQAVMEQLLEAGETQCFVPHSSVEAPDSPCSRQLAGSNHDVRVLYTRLVQSYADGNWTQDVKIPNHPHCTHVVTPER